MLNLQKGEANTSLRCHKFVHCGCEMCCSESRETCKMTSCLTDFQPSLESVINH